MQFHLDDLSLFTRIAELGTLSAAARERNVPVSQVTRALKRLEQACGVRLLHRTTHGLSLTDEGDTLLAYGRRMLDSTAELESELSGKIAGPSGWVRVSVSPILAQSMIAPSLPGLYQRWPGLRIDINASDRMVDMARDGIDIAIRTGTPNSDTVIARQIGTHGRALYAAPAYLAAHGTPQHPDDLRHHRLITNSVSPTLNVWARTSAVAGKPAPAPWLAQGTTRADNTALQMVLAVQGVGIARLHDLMALPLVRAGTLVPLLQDFFENPRVPMYAVTLPNRQRLPKIRACVDYWAEQLAQLEA